MTLITISDPRSPVSEAYRTLRTNLSFYSMDNPLRTIVVTSPATKADKSSAVANLAVTMAQGGKETILVDADMRLPSLHTLFGLNNDRGLSDAIRDDSAELPLKSTSIDNLRLLTSGTQPPNPGDLIGSPRVERVIERLQHSAEIVLFGAPPVIAVTDAVVLGNRVDGILLVIEAGKTRRDHADQAKNIIEQAHVRLIGAALTNAPVDPSVGKYG